MRLDLSDVTDADLDDLAVAFADWPKERSLFEDYLRQSQAGAIEMVLARAGGAVAGYLLVRWESGYPPFAAAGVPEVCDFNVLPGFRRQGVGAALMDEAEARAGTRSPVVGLGVGLYTDYGTAQRLYVRRGYQFDGAGVVIGDAPVPPGTMIRLDDEPELKLSKRLRVQAEA